MFYFKFTTTAGEELYGKINAAKKAIDLEKLKVICNAQSIQQVTKKEFDEETEENA